MFAAVLDDLQPFAVAGVKMRRLPQHLRVTDHAVQRGAEFVAHVREKRALGAVGLVCGVLGHLQFVRAFRDEALEARAFAGVDPGAPAHRRVPDAQQSGRVEREGRGAAVPGWCDRERETGGRSDLPVGIPGPHLEGEGAARKVCEAHLAAGRPLGPFVRVPDEPGLKGQPGRRIEARDREGELNGFAVERQLERRSRAAGVGAPATAAALLHAAENGGRRRGPAGQQRIDFDADQSVATAHPEHAAAAGCVGFVVEAVSSQVAGVTGDRVGQRLPRPATVPADEAAERELVQRVGLADLRVDRVGCYGEQRVRVETGLAGGGKRGRRHQLLAGGIGNERAVPGGKQRLPIEPGPHATPAGIGRQAAGARLERDQLGVLPGRPAGPATRPHEAVLRGAEPERAIGFLEHRLGLTLVPGNRPLRDRRVSVKPIRSHVLDRADKKAGRIGDRTQQFAGRGRGGKDQGHLVIASDSKHAVLIDGQEIVAVAFELAGPRRPVRQAHEPGRLASAGGLEPIEQVGRPEVQRSAPAQQVLRDGGTPPVALIEEGEPAVELEARGAGKGGHPKAVGTILVQHVGHVADQAMLVLGEAFTHVARGVGEQDARVEGGDGQRSVASPQHRAQAALRHLGREWRLPALEAVALQQETVAALGQADDAAGVAAHESRERRCHELRLAVPRCETAPVPAVQRVARPAQEQRVVHAHQPPTGGLRKVPHLYVAAAKARDEPAAGVPRRSVVPDHAPDGSGRPQAFRQPRQPRFELQRAVGTRTADAELVGRGDVDRAAGIRGEAANPGGGYRNPAPGAAVELPDLAVNRDVDEAVGALGQVEDLVVALVVLRLEIADDRTTRLGGRGRGRRAGRRVQRQEGEHGGGRAREVHRLRKVRRAERSTPTGPSAWITFTAGRRRQT